MQSSIKQVELAAIHDCCIDILGKSLSGPIRIYCDSVAALRAISSYRITSKLTMECSRMLEEIAATNDTQLIWIPAHCGIYGNIQADAIAKYAANEATFGPEPFIAPNRNIGKIMNDEWLEEQTKLAWRDTRGNAHSKRFMSDVNPQITGQLLGMSKQDSRTIVGLITGHCKLNDHFAKIGIRNDPDCDLCGRERETAAHIICNCESLKAIRAEIYMSEVTEPQKIFNESLHKLIQYFNKCCVKFPRLKRIF